MKHKQQKHKQLINSTQLIWVRHWKCQRYRLTEMKSSDLLSSCRCSAVKEELAFDCLHGRCTCTQLTHVS